MSNVKKSLDLNTCHKSTTILYTPAGMVQTSRKCENPALAYPRSPSSSAGFRLHNKAGEGPGKPKATPGKNQANGHWLELLGL